MKVYVVMQFAETDGDAVDEFSGAIYADESLANKHAAHVWGGSVRAVEIASELPEWMGTA